MAKRRCKFGKVKSGARKGLCRKTAPKGRAKAEGRRRKKAPMTGTGTFCITASRPRKKGQAGRGGIAFSTRCYQSRDSAVSALNRATPGAYSVMIHRKSAKRTR